MSLSTDRTGGRTLSCVLIVGINPYFLERENIWFEENLAPILQARKTQYFFEENTLFLEKDQSIKLSQVLRQLDEMGYEKVYQVEEPGEFSRRGGAVDVFPVNQNFAVRLDFWGNQVERIERLDIKIADEKKARAVLKKRLKNQRLFSDLRGIKPGDYLVHLDHGVGRFTAKTRVDVRVRPSQVLRGSDPHVAAAEYYVLEYAAGDKLYVPVGLERKLSRYVGFREPKISRLSSPFWERTKRKIKEEAEKFARELLAVYAKREVTMRPAYQMPGEVEAALSSTFAYEETSDQRRALQDIEEDLAKTRPMDRIVCGDVGFGKTEVALRALVRAVAAGYQAAMICPTTLLASQHFQGFRERLKGLPVRSAMLSRLQSKKEQKETIHGLLEGKIDIVVATHRLLSKDVEFAKLGLLVIDDEQRFGVKQKEKFKKLRAGLDILSLSATPIPRTLYLALTSLKAVSLIQTPPPGRLPIKTFILPWSEKVIKQAINQELKRKGQVYYLHNRIETIEVVRKNLQELTPKARVAIIHGRLPEKQLVEVMAAFQRKKIDVLLATTIIENGLDLPNVNTLIVADASKLGLSQAYQIRGRVGRARQQAFSYFFFGQRPSDKAGQRLKALKEAEALGSGYRLAMRDLEIRGAGNILGKEQSGNVNKVGLNLYCQMLSEAVERMRQDN